MTQDETIARLLDYQREHVDAKLREAIGRGLYPTAWGSQWTADQWQHPTGKTCLNDWLAVAMRNVSRITMGRWP